MVITVWRFVVSGLFNLVGTALLHGGIHPLLSGIRSAPREMILGSAIVTVTNVGFVYSLLKVDPAKALLLISLNPLWAALLGYACLGDTMERRTVVAQGVALLSIALVFVPNLMEMMSFALVLATDGVEAEIPAEVYDMVPLVTGFSIASFMTYSRSCSLRGISDASMEASLSVAAVLTTALAIYVGKRQGVESFTAGLSWNFWLFLAIDGLCLAGYNGALVIAPRYLPSAEVALVLLGETILGPVWVFFVFGTVPSAWTLIGGAVLLLTLVLHEIAGMNSEDEGHGQLVSIGPRMSPKSSVNRMSIKLADAKAPMLP
mmetsp:Transcript_47639/g.84155  ORF Transcript_47639/g.84155 Transcript_47639/m.84155 type:complete len:318 (+) Transcript_47639:2-955(+)